MKHLEEDYKVIVDNMVPAQDLTNNREFIVDTTTFYSISTGKPVSMTVLTNEDDKQIFAMQDGRFILEIENFDDDSVSYYYSEDINDLL
jgi:hypothetical protein